MSEGCSVGVGSKFNAKGVRVVKILGAGVEIRISLHLLLKEMILESEKIEKLQLDHEWLKKHYT